LWSEFYRVPRGYLIRFPGFADFELESCSGSAACLPCEGVDKPTLDHLYNNQVRPLQLALAGEHIYHGSAVELGDVAVTFIAASGFGKSTLAAGLAVRGHGMLTDDGLHLVPGSDGYAVQPGPAVVRLRTDSREQLMPDDEPMPAVSYTSKGMFRTGGALAACDEARPLRAAYFLGPGTAEEIEIAQLAGHTSVAEWVAHSFLIEVEDRSAIGDHFARVVELCASVPSFTLDYPRRYDIIDPLRERLIAHAAELSGQAPPAD
jgi:hypothetical protein